MKSVLNKAKKWLLEQRNDIPVLGPLLYNLLLLSDDPLSNACLLTLLIMSFFRTFIEYLLGKNSRENTLFTSSSALKNIS
jgi:hypothetical protein